MYIHRHGDNAQWENGEDDARGYIDKVHYVGYVVLVVLVVVVCFNLVASVVISVDRSVLALVIAFNPTHNAEY